METSSHFLEDVVHIEALLIGALAFIAGVFLVGLLINVPVVLIYFRSRQARSLTDKFILFVLLSDLVSLFVFVPVSFVLVLEYTSLVQSAGGGEESQNGGGGEERPVFLGGESNTAAQLSEAYSHQAELNANFTNSCVQQWIYILHKFIFIMTANLSVMSALKIAIERYFAVVTPLHYHKILKSSVIFCVSIGSSIISLAFAVIIAMEPSEFSSVLYVCQCASRFLGQSWSSVSSSLQVDSSSSSAVEFSDDGLDEAGPVANSFLHQNPQESLLHTDNSLRVWWPVLKLVHASVFFVVPVIVMMFVYLRIWTEARRQNARLTHQTPYILPADVTKPEGLQVDGLQLIFSKFKLMQRLKRRARMDRAARVAMLTIGLVIMCFGPLYYHQISSAIFSLINSYRSGRPTEGDKVQEVDPLSELTCLLPILVACLHPLLSPIVYVYRYKRVRSELKALLRKLISSTKCHFPTSSYSSSSDCQDIVHQINHLAQKLPSSCIDVGEDSLESQSTSSADCCDTSTVTIDLQSATSTMTECGKGLSTNITLSEDDDATKQIDYSEADMMECPEYADAERRISIQENGGFFSFISCWVNTYSRRWNHHRESVTSTASFVTLLSSRGKACCTADI